MGEARHTAGQYSYQEGADPTLYQVIDPNGFVAGFLRRGTGGKAEADMRKRHAEFIVRACNAHDDLVAFAQFVLRGIQSGHVTNASFIDSDLDGETVEVETLSSYAEKVLAKAGAAA